MLKPRDPSKVLPGPFCPSCAHDGFVSKGIRVAGVRNLVQAIICAKCGTLVGIHGQGIVVRRPKS